MNGWRTMQIAALVVFATSGTALRAGALSATSRGSVAITITIPPQVRNVEQGGASSTGDALCVSANGLRTYHIAIVSAGSLPADVGVAPSSAMDAARVGRCGREPVSVAAIEVPTGSSAQAVTLLVVPD